MRASGWKIILLLGAMVVALGLILPKVLRTGSEKEQFQTLNIKNSDDTSLIDTVVHTDVRIVLDKEDLRRRNKDVEDGTFDAFPREATKETAKKLPDLLPLQKNEFTQASLLDENGECPKDANVFPKKDGDFLILKSDAVLTGQDLDYAQFEVSPVYGYPIVNSKLTNVVSKNLCEFTPTHIGSSFAIVFDDRVMMAPMINTVMCGDHGTIAGGFTAQEVYDFALGLNVGTLPTKLRVVDVLLIRA
ncbi:MAG: hypothetical protein V3U57_01285 [Robiginitomaculum sp.]